MKNRNKRIHVSATVKRLREILSEFPDKEIFTINENPADILIGCIHPDGVEYRRAYMKWGLLRITADEFRKILDEMKNGYHEN